MTEFCPELNLMVTGPTREDVADRMRAALSEHCAQKGGTVGNISDEIIVRHMIHSLRHGRACSPPRSGKMAWPVSRTGLRVRPLQ